MLLKQKSINGFTVKTVKPAPITKEGILEHLLAIMTTCDLVHIPLLLGPLISYLMIFT